ncbi:MAG: hypothetical protein Q8P41_25925 [Pseudomonadota bacterium]|nr:hypothetical protein [Pseudomonadota bacterium]
MPVLGVVLTHPDPGALADLVRAIPGVVLVGNPVSNRLPAAFETARKGDDEPLFEALRALPGVLAVDLAFADFSDLPPPDEVSR